MANNDARKEQGKTEVKGIEPILKEGMANYFRGLSNVGGRLYLTERYLTFRPHALNLRRGEEVIALKDIVAVQRRNTLLLVPNGFSVILRDGTEARFVVYGRDEWVQAIVDACNRLHPATKQPTPAGEPPG